MTDQRLLAASFRYNPNLQQAAQQQSYSFTFPGCGIGSSTCSQFCDLFGGRCDLVSRLRTYEPDLLDYGHIVGDGPDLSTPTEFQLLEVGYRTFFCCSLNCHPCPRLPIRLCPSNSYVHISAL